MKFAKGLRPEEGEQKIRKSVQAWCLLGLSNLAPLFSFPN